MKKMAALMMAALLFTLCGCSIFSFSSDDEEQSFSAEYTIRTTAKPTEVFFDVPYSESVITEEATRAYRSDALDFTELRQLFSDSVFADSDDTLHMWQNQIRYCIEGATSSADTNELSEISRELISVSGFPGMRETTQSDANVYIRFTDDVKSSVTLETDSSGVVHSGTIIIPNVLPTDKRKALLEQSVMQLCGFEDTVHTQLDSVLRIDAPSDSLTEVDLILLDILYGEMQPGMTRSACLYIFDAHFKENN